MGGSRKTLKTQPSSIMKILTRRQQEVYEYMISHLSIEDRLPTIREIGKRFGFKSTNAGRGYIEVLINKGYLEKRGPNYRLSRVSMSEAIKDLGAFDEYSATINI